MDPISPGLGALQTRCVGTLDKGTLQPSESIESVWKRIGEGLEAVACKRDKDPLKLSEEPLTQLLYDEIERRPGYRPYYFHKEYGEQTSSGHARRGDVAVLTREDGRFLLDGILYASGARFLQLEAKRLPTPGTQREREYLSGDRGGVERFKRGQHGGGLKTVGIVGYVQRRDFAHWRKTINAWVDDLAARSTPDLPWDKDDKLHLEMSSPRLAWLRSNSLRVTDKQKLTIRHVWVQLARDGRRIVSP